MRSRRDLQRGRAPSAPLAIPSLCLPNAGRLSADGGIGRRDYESRTAGRNVQHSRAQSASARPTIPSLDFLEAGRGSAVSGLFHCHPVEHLAGRSGDASSARLKIPSLNLLHGDQGFIGSGSQSGDAPPPIPAQPHTPSLVLLLDIGHGHGSTGRGRGLGGQTGTVGGSKMRGKSNYVRDVDCSCESCTLRSSGVKIKKWIDGDGKSYLRTSLLEDRDHKYWKDSPGEVYDDNKSLFHLYKYENFRTNLNTLKKAITLEIEKIKFDELAVERESNAFPRQQFTSHGNPYYDTSEARK